MPKKNIEAGDELFYDYGLVVEGKQTKKVKKRIRMSLRTKKLPQNHVGKK